MTYELIDSGDGKKLERFGEIVLIRPSSQALWQPAIPEAWKRADASFSREGGWRYYRKVPDSWIVEIDGLKLKAALTDFGHLGIFPEHAQLWNPVRPLIKKGMRILNLFAYSGSATLAAAQQQAEVCHVDAAKGMVQWARENAHLNKLEKAPIRWIVEDVKKFLAREQKRRSFYEGIILDPPTFGRGSKGEVFKIERDLLPLLSLCKEILSKEASFVILSCHTPGFTPLVLEQVMQQLFGERLEAGEMVLSGKNFIIPSGSYCIWLSK